MFLNSHCASRHGCSSPNLPKAFCSSAGAAEPVGSTKIVWDTAGVCSGPPHGGADSLTLWSNLWWLRMLLITPRGYCHRDCVAAEQNKWTEWIQQYHTKKTSQTHYSLSKVPWKIKFWGNQNYSPIDVKCQPAWRDSAGLHRITE